MEEQSVENESTLFCWGLTSAGQLGLGGIEEEQVFTPKQLTFFHKRKIRNIACGEQHTVILLENGTVYTCGCNDFGQLALSTSTKRPAQVEHLASQVITQVYSGAEHSVAVNDRGQLLTWGNNSKGQLGVDKTEDSAQPVPRLVRSLSSMVVTHVACGNRHTLALTNESNLYSWGHNNHGQLGLSAVGGERYTPQLIQCVRGLSFIQVAAGGAHSFALTVSGALFGWGKNSFGQLGITAEKDHAFPTLVKTLRSHRVCYVCCGEEHTAALTEDGGVFTFGAGTYGQLGHNTKQCEPLPRKIFEFMGNRVTQIACGRCHTLAYVADSGRLYSFGLGGNGQLGTGNAIARLNPTPIHGSWVSRHSSENDQSFVVNQIYSGGDQSFAVVYPSQARISPIDYREINSMRHTLQLTQELAEEWICVPADSPIPADMHQKMERIFQSQSCLNSSFLMKNKEHYGCSPKWHGVDLQSARETWEKLKEAKNPRVESLMRNSLRQLLLELVVSPPDVEAMRLYLTLPWCHLFEDIQNYDTIIEPFGSALCNLAKSPARVLDHWWSSLQPSHFNRVLTIYKSYFLHIINEPFPQSEYDMMVKHRGMKIALNVMSKLSQVNEENNQIIPYTKFYIPQLKEQLDIRREYMNWIHSQVNHNTGVNIMTLQQNTSFSFCNYPFVFDAPAKTIMLQTDAVMQMQYAVDEVQRRNLSTIFFPTIDPVNPCLVLFVTRNNIVQETVSQLTKYGAGDLKKPLKVIFMGEEAVDEGGVRKEFFMLILREILDPKYGMFVYIEESRRLWFNDQTFEEAMMYQLIGVICGLAIYNTTIIDLPFPLALYKKLLKKPVNLEDLKDLYPAVGKGLEDLLMYDGDDLEEVFCINFEVTKESFGEVRHIELIPGGTDIPVNKSNRQSYVDAYVDYQLNASVGDHFQAFYDGFHKVCGGRVLELFHPQELQQLVVGNEDYDWKELEKHTEYKGEYYRNHPTITAFWEVFWEFSLEQKKKFLLFLTGSDRIPIHGMKALRFIIQPTGGGEEFLPVAHTCFNLLDLPRYQSKQKLQEKMLIAIEQTEGFGIV